MVLRTRRRSSRTTRTQSIWSPNLDPPVHRYSVPSSGGTSASTPAAQRSISHGSTSTLDPGASLGLPVPPPRSAHLSRVATVSIGARECRSRGAELRCDLELRCRVSRSTGLEGERTCHLFPAPWEDRQALLLDVISTGEGQLRSSADVGYTGPRSCYGALRTKYVTRGARLSWGLHASTHPLGGTTDICRCAFGVSCSVLLFTCQGLKVMYEVRNDPMPISPQSDRSHGSRHVQAIDTLRAECDILLGHVRLSQGK